MSFFLYQLLTLTNLSVFILTFICYSEKSILRLVGEEYPYIDSIISTIFVLGIFNLELPFSGSLGSQKNQSGAIRDSVAVGAIDVGEVEHACIRTIATVTAATEPSIAGIREACGI